MSVIVYAGIDINYHKIKIFLSQVHQVQMYALSSRLHFCLEVKVDLKKIIFSISFFEFIYKIKCDLSYN